MIRKKMAIKSRKTILSLFCQNKDRRYDAIYLSDRANSWTKLVERFYDL